MTVAVNVVVAPATSVAVVGVTATLIAGGAELPQPTIRANAAKPANTREDRRTFDMAGPFFLKRLDNNKHDGDVPYKGLTKDCRGAVEQKHTECNTNLDLSYHADRSYALESPFRR